MLDQNTPHVGESRNYCLKHTESSFGRQGNVGLITTRIEQSAVRPGPHEAGRTQR